MSKTLSERLRDLLWLTPRTPSSVRQAGDAIADDIEIMELNFGALEIDFEKLLINVVSIEDYTALEAKLIRTQTRLENIAADLALLLEKNTRLKDLVRELVGDDYVRQQEEMRG